jgi:hypothetical protein
VDTSTHMAMRGNTGPHCVSLLGNLSSIPIGSSPAFGTESKGGDAQPVRVVSNPVHTGCGPTHVDDQHLAGESASPMAIGRQAGMADDPLVAPQSR